MSKIDASPTKQFFISMLTRDVALDRSILDLVDNSVDAAMRVGNIRQRRIDIFASKDTFSIEDNCGGISQKDAEEYAFRFGRTDDNKGSPHSVGQFGVGLKRTMFKLGSKFEILSKHKNSNFKIEVDVKRWLEIPEWEFELQQVDLDSKTANHGTKIVVSSLHESTSQQLGLETFMRDIIDEVSRAHFKVISQGLHIRVNGERVGKFSIEVIDSEILKGAQKELVLGGGVKVKILIGFSKRDYNLAGWYVVCNGRLVATAERSEVTGWGVEMRKFHPDFAYFRGVVEFDADNSGLLPWTTTKTGVDTDNPVYIQALHQMKIMMRPALVLMSDRAKEKKELLDGKLEASAIVDEFSIEKLIDT